MPLASMMSVTPCGCTAGRFRLCAGQPRRAATTFPTPINIVTRRWPKGCSGRCLSTSKRFRPALAEDVEVKAWRGVFGASFTWWTPARLPWLPPASIGLEHRRRKAAAKLHVRLDLHSLLPRFVLVESAKAADSIRAAQVCAGVKPGEIVIFDRAYVDFVHLGVLNEEGVFWVTRSKEGLCFRVVKRLPKAADKRILRDDLVVLKTPDSRANYPHRLRRVRAMVEVDGQQREMEFLTNNLAWSAASVADLYRCRWQIEVFFKQIKQSLQLCDFLGNSANAVRWQVWTALLLYVLMRFLSVISGWDHSFTRLFTLLRATLWRKIDLWELLRFCGTAGGHFRYLATPQDAYLPGFAW
jgi:Transposase DDE domain